MMSGHFHEEAASAAGSTSGRFREAAGVTGRLLTEMRPLLVDEEGRRLVEVLPSPELAKWRTHFAEIDRLCARGDGAAAASTTGCNIRSRFTSRWLRTRTRAQGNSGQPASTRDRAEATPKTRAAGGSPFGLLGCRLGSGAIGVLRRAADHQRPATGRAEMADGAGQVASAASQVASSSQSLAQGSSEQAASIEETSASTEEINSMTRKNADHSRSAAEMMVESQRKCRRRPIRHWKAW